MSGPGLVASGLRVAVPRRTLVENFACALGGGQFIAVLGGNGTGKSLLLRTLAGLRPAAGGTVKLDGEDIDALPRRTVATRLGFLPQDPDAAPHGSLFEAVLLGRYAHLGFLEASGADEERRAAQALDAVGLGSMGPRELATLSGGEQRRAAIARLLVQAPSIYLLDEPTNHLDPAHQLGILEYLRVLSRGSCAVVASLHDPNLALRFADRVWMLPGNGVVDALETADLEPAHLARLYGIDYQETRLGGQRFMAPAGAAGSH